MEQKNQRNSRKRLNSLILLVAFTAVMLIVSTYAWFSTQKNVTLSGLKGTVNVAEGLQISLDALSWANSIDLGNTTSYFETANTKYNMKNLTETPEGGEPVDVTDQYAFSIMQPYGETFNSESTGGKDYVTKYHKNVIPTELLPVSTNGREDIGKTEFKMYRGTNTDGIVLSDIHQVKPFDDSVDEEPGYYAIDFFLQNSSSAAATANPDAIIEDWLQLEKYSAVKLENTYSTGLQNTLRVAFVLYDNAGGKEGDDDVTVNKTPQQNDIIKATVGQNILDVAIWEPNASGTGYVTVPKEGGGTEEKATTGFAAHVENILNNNNRVTWSVADAKTYLNKTITDPEQINFLGSQALPTYAVTGKSAAIDDLVISNIYNWAITDALPAIDEEADPPITEAGDGYDDTTGLSMQYTLQTSTDGFTDSQQLVSAKNGTDRFKIYPGEYHRLTMYVWLEGQDVDTTNWASLGGDVTIDVGLSKLGTDAQKAIMDAEAAAGSGD